MVEGLLENGGTLPWYEDSIYLHSLLYIQQIMNN